LSEKVDFSLSKHISGTKASILTILCSVSHFARIPAVPLSEATDIDYFITNVSSSIVTPQWIVDTYGARNWVEVFYPEAKGWLGLKEYQVREKRSLLRHFILVFCAYTFILWHQMTGGLRRRWANKPLNTFTEAIDAFRTAMTRAIFRLVDP
jgi:hypothetical protein